MASEKLFRELMEDKEPVDIEKDCIFYAKTDEGINIKNLSEFLANNLDGDATFQFNKKGIFLKGADSDERIYIDLFLDKKNFSKYFCAYNYARGVPLSNFNNMVKNLKKKDKVSFFIKKSEPKKIRSRIINEDRQRNSGSFTPTKDPKFFDVKLPDCYDEPVTIPATELQRMCRDISQYKTIDAICYPEGLIFKATEGELMMKKFNFGREATEEDCKNNMVFQNIYDTKLIIQMAKIYGFSKRVHIYTMKRTPMKINADVGQLGTINILIREDSTSVDDDEDEVEE